MLIDIYQLTTEGASTLDSEICIVYFIGYPNITDDESIIMILVLIEKLQKLIL